MIGENPQIIVEATVEHQKDGAAVILQRFNRQSGHVWQLGWYHEEIPSSLHRDEGFLYL